MLALAMNNGGCCMFIYRPNTGYVGRKRPTRLQRRESDDRINAMLSAAEDTTTEADATRDVFMGTVDADFELMDEREVHIGGTTIKFGCGPQPIIEHKRHAA
jgi:hypothetical protein